MNKTGGAILAVLLLANALCAGTAHAGVTHRWPAEGDALDAVGDADGTVHGGVTFGEGKVGQGFVFDGVDGTISFGTTTADVDFADFTSSFAIRTTMVDTIGGVLGKRSICGFSPFWDIRSSEHGTLSLEVYESSTNTGVGTSLPV